MQEMKKIELDRTGSTNDYAKALDGSFYDAPDGGSRPVLVTALEQTAGRGRYGRSFHSPRGTGIYMTYSFRPQFSPEASIRSTLVTAAVVHRVLTRYTGDPVTIKWVNDLYRGGRKIVGILVEGVPAVPGADSVAGSGADHPDAFDRLVIGIGVNLFPSPVPEELADKIGFLFGDAPDGGADCGGMPEDGPDARDRIRRQITDEIAEGLSEAFLRTPYEPDGYVEYYKKHCVNYPEDAE